MPNKRKKYLYDSDAALSQYIIKKSKKLQNNEQVSQIYSFMYMYNLNILKSNL